MKDPSALLTVQRFALPLTPVQAVMNIVFITPLRCQASCWPECPTAACSTVVTHVGPSWKTCFSHWSMLSASTTQSRTQTTSWSHPIHHMPFHAPAALLPLDLNPSLPPTPLVQLKLNGLNLRSSACRARLHPALVTAAPMR